MSHDYYLIYICFFVLQSIKWERDSINRLIEEAILKADKKGVKVLSLGLLNQASHHYQYATTCFYI